MQKLVSVFTCNITKIVTTYTYRTHSITSGIEKVEIEYPKGYLEQYYKQLLGRKGKETSDLDDPKKQMYTNPATGREVSYYRAKFLGLIS